MAVKTNSMRFLDSRRIPYRVYTFPPEVHSADGVAEVVGLPPGHVYKTLVVVRPRGRPLLVMVAGDRELNLKRLAKAVGEKKLRMASYREAESLTGLQVGGISALALLNKRFEVYIDRAALALDEVLVSAGQRGINLGLKVRDLVRVTEAEAVAAADEPDGTTQS